MRLVCHVFPAHSLEGVAALHNYLAFIFTASAGPAVSDSSKRAGQRRSDLSSARTMSGVLGPICHRMITVRRVAAEVGIQQPLSSWGLFPAVPALDLGVLAW